MSAPEAAEAPPALQEASREYVALVARKRQAEEGLGAIETRMKELEPHILEAMAESGMQRQTVDGFTLFPQRELYVNKKPEKDGILTVDVCRALQECGLGYMVTDGYSASSLKAKVKEWRENEVDIPPELLRVINVGEGVKLIARKA